MYSIILPIKQKYVKAIFNGSKTFELRRKAPKKEIKKIVIYETYPTSKIVGTLLVEETHHLKIDELWQLTKNKNSLTKKEFQSYFQNQEYGYAFKVSKQEELSIKDHKTIEEYNLKYPPQGFVYVK